MGLIKSEDISVRHQNCISLIKLLASLQVMFGHVRRHLGLSIPVQLELAIGYIRGVPIFFILSGFLIWQSLGRTKNFTRYFQKRFLRVYPELWVCVTIEISSIVIFYSDWNVKDPSLFAMTQGTFLQFWTPNSLRGYGCGTPNGSLWTMCVTIQFYLISWVVYKFLHKRKLKVWIPCFVGSVVISIVGQVFVGQFNRELLLKLYNQTIMRYGWLFLTGCFLSEFNVLFIPWLKKYWYALLIIGAIPYLSNNDLIAGYGFIQSILMVSGLIGFAYLFPILALKKDISYPIFLYHMIVVNIFISLGWTGNWFYGIVVIVLSCVVAYLSTATIGKWSVIMKMNAHNGI